ncbi:MAG: hypothetical protein JNG88_08325 [Phycisphaerales bacterium]|nr:hypothetical protein [Phycisphaerales bacterium]
MLRFFRFHPCSTGNDPPSEPASPLLTIVIADDAPNPAERIMSTPLILTDVDYTYQEVWRVVVQTNKRVRSFLITQLTCSSSSYSLDWEYPADSAGYSLTPSPSGWPPLDSASPTIGNVESDGTGADYIFIHANDRDDGDPPVVRGRLLALDPSTGQRVWQREIWAETQPLSTPAVGPDAVNPWNNIYIAAFGAAQPTNRHLHAFRADGLGADSSADITLGPQVQSGSYGSPGVHHYDDVSEASFVIASDDSCAYAFDNVAGVNSDLILFDHECVGFGQTGENFSGTSVVFPDRNVIWINEASTIHRFNGDDPTSEAERGVLQLLVNKGTWEWSQFAGDSADRFYVATPGTYGPDDDSRVVRAFKNETETQEPPDLPRILNAWSEDKYTPPTIATHNLLQEFEAPVAIDLDGTLIVCNRGYVLALRPLLGDFNGDCETNCMDFDPFVLALCDPGAWNAGPQPDEGFGLTFGINLVGVGDCNNDGRFDNYDIDCAYALICPDELCCMDPEEGAAPPGEEETSQRQTERERVSEGFARLRAMFGR